MKDASISSMKSDIHPQYFETHVRCACGNTWTTGGTVSEMTLDICSNCHPFYTGKQKTIDARGRITKFQERTAKAQATAEAKKPKKPRKTSTA